MASSPKETAKDDWKAYTTAEYREVAGRLVHFSGKGVNSNAAACGIRLDRSSALPLPYVSVRCLLARDLAIETDYTKNAGITATVVKQIRKLCSGETDLDLEETRVHLTAIAEAQASAYREGTEAVSPRLRQLLLPRGEGYVAVTPLPSGGLSREINRRVQAHNEAVAAERNAAVVSPPAGELPDDMRPLRLGTLGVGGANPQNVGALVRDMQTVLVFEAPKENPAIRAAYAIHYRGIRLGLPRRLMLAWREWRRSAKADGRLRTSMDSRDAERALLAAIGEAVLNQGVQAWRRLEEYREHLPGGALLSESLRDAVIRGLIDKSERGKDWPRQFGERLAQTLGAYSFGEGMGMELLDDDSLCLIARWFEEEAR